MSISRLTAGDFAQWENLFRQYIAFYKSSLPDEQYQNTFDRILDPKGDLNAFVIREENGTLNGLAHYFTHPSTWSDKPVCYLNDLFVNPDIRGKGYGRKLIVACGKAAEENGCKEYYWMTQHGNAVARKLYDTFGESEFTDYRIKLPSDKW